jgi:hypothetical protein
MEHKVDNRPQIENLESIVNAKYTGNIEVGQVSAGTVWLALAALSMAVAAYLLG